jgi:hypothetical protein
MGPYLIEENEEVKDVKKIGEQIDKRSAGIK